MDDELERPTHEVNAVDVNDETALSEDEDDGGPDWTRFSAMTTSKPYIPKRGDKEHEPLGGTSFNSGASGSSLQRYKLEKVRAAMFGAIDVDRITSRCAASCILLHIRAVADLCSQQILKPFNMATSKVLCPCAEISRQLFEYHGSHSDYG